MALDAKSNGHPENLAASRLPEFENHLRQFLYKEKGRVLLISCISGALKAITDSTLALKVERQASAMPLKELEDKIARFDQELQGLEKERELSLLLLDGRIKGVITEVEADLDAFKQETIIKLTPADGSGVSSEKPGCRRFAPGDGRNPVCRVAGRLHHLAAPGNRETLPEIGRHPRGISRPASMPCWSV